MNTYLRILFIAFLCYTSVIAQDCKINLIIVYTDQAADSLEGNKLAIKQIISAVNDLNTSLIYSNVNHSIELVRTIRLSEFESGSFSDDINSFQENTHIKNLRDKYHADIAALVLTNDEFCGLPYLDDKLANSSTAYCVVNFYCMINSFALSHQIAHLYGCSHYIEVLGEVDDAPYSYGHGYDWRYDENTGFSTIVGVYDDDFCAENGEDACNIIPYFSGPDVTYRNVPIGNSDLHNNSAVLNKNASVLGSFKLIPSVQKSLIDTVQHFDIAIATALDTLSSGTHYLISDTAIVEFIAGKSITLNPGFTAEEGVRFETRITQPPKQCQ